MAEFASLLQFHDRAVVASLKPLAPCRIPHESLEFHDRAVVASLKRGSDAEVQPAIENSTTVRSWPH